MPRRSPTTPSSRPVRHGADEDVEGHLPAGRAGSCGLRRYDR
jgi:hypothetical protein